MKQFIVLSVLCGCLAAPASHALEAVALPSDGAGSGNGAATYALGNQVAAQNAAIGAQGTMLQQVNQSVTSLTTTVNNLTTLVNRMNTYIANATCAGGQLEDSGSAISCVKGTNGGDGKDSAPKDCTVADIPNRNSSWGYHTYQAQGGIMTKQQLYARTYSGATLLHGYSSNSMGQECADTIQCNNGKWVVLNRNCGEGGFVYPTNLDGERI